MVAPLPENEAERLQALHDLNILDTADDPFFHNAVKLASKILKAPISLVSLVDADRQWFKAIEGLKARETSRDVAFCAHAILGQDVFVVTDASQDERFSENPLVTNSPFIRSYAGAPLIDSKGNALGTLCVISPVITGWSKDELATLSMLADMVVRHLETLRFAQRAAERDALAQTLARVEHLHESVVSSMAEGVIVQAKDGAIKIANPAAERILGLSLDQLHGRTSIDPRWQSIREDGSAFPGDAHPAMTALRTGETVEGVVMGIVQPSGEQRWIKINAQPLFNEVSDAPNEVVTTFTDITKEKETLRQLESKRQRLAMALDVGRIGVVERDKLRGAISTSGSAEALGTFGPLTDVREGTLVSLVPPEHQARLISAWNEHLAGGPRLNLETPLLMPDGSQRWALVGSEKLVDAQGNHTGALIVFKDIHQRKLIELELKESLQELARVSRVKDIFLANMGHEIRTPLNGVMGMATALSRTSLSADQSEMVSLIRSSGEVLDRVLSDVLDFSRLESGKLELENEPFSLRKAIEDASLLMAVRAEDKGLRFRIEPSPNADGQWIGDSVRIRQIVANLISNAIKFTDKGGVTLRLDATGTPGDCTTDWVSIEVEDTGVGIPDDAQARIFERFEQADKSINRNYGGTGLGLSICRSLATLMGGEISMVSEPAVGSVFRVRFPLKRETAQANEPITQGPLAENNSAGSQFADGRLLKVLLVDDNLTNQKITTAMLSAFNCAVVTASNGQDAFDKYSSDKFDLVLMDMAMPVMDGLEATRRIRRWEVEKGERRTPISMLTAHTADHAKEQSRIAGADFHITKPVTPVSLLAGLEKAMKAARARAVAA